MAAGMGTRFGKMTAERPKGFVEVGGMPMIERSVQTLLDCGITKIIIGTGYHREAYEAFAIEHPEIQCVFSERYAETNSLYTLWNCREAIGHADFLLLESDLVFSQSAITELLHNEHPDIMLITPVRKFQDQYYVEYNADHVLTRCSTNKTAIDAKGELVGIHKLSASFYNTLCRDYESKLEASLKLGYEYELLHLSTHGSPMYVLNSETVEWYEIDDEHDLIFSEQHVVPRL